MAWRVLTGPDAARALSVAEIWLTQSGSGTVGRRQWHAVRDARKRIQDNPYIGPLSEDHAGCRQLVVEGYRIIYRIEARGREQTGDGRVVVLIVAGPGQP